VRYISLTHPTRSAIALLRSAFGIALCYELIDVGFPCVNPTYGRGDRTRICLTFLLNGCK